MSDSSIERDMKSMDRIAKKLGDDMRERTRADKAELERIDKQGGPQTPEEWAFYATTHRVGPEELDELDGKDFLTECFRRAMHGAWVSCSAKHRYNASNATNKVDTSSPYRE